MDDISESAVDDLEGLDASAAHVAGLLSTEPADSKLSLVAFLTWCSLCSKLQYSDT